MSAREPNRHLPASWTWPKAIALLALLGFVTFVMFIVYIAVTGQGGLGDMN